MRVMNSSKIENAGDDFDEEMSDTGSSGEPGPAPEGVHIPERVHVVPDECDAPDWDPGLTTSARYSKPTS